jgi:uncharacterized protein YkwD
MKRTLAFSLFFLFLILGVSLSAQGQAGLFTPYEGPLQLDPLSVNPALVMRQRLVSIRFDLLPMTAGQSVILNLFEDLEVHAVCDRVETNVSDGFVWNGHIQDLPEGTVSLTVAGQSMAGTVEMPPEIYHIRPIEDQIHVIREIQPPVLRTELFSADAGPSAVEQQVVGLVNLERQIVNLHPLAWDEALGSSARAHSSDMAQRNYVSHTSPDGREFYERITAAGYSWNTCGENIAAGYTSAQAVMNGWMTSPGHKANILNSAFCDLGVGYAFGSTSTYGHYWTQDFGRRMGVSVCTLPENPDADIDGDGDLDGSDLARLIRAYGSARNDWNFDPQCDFIPDSQVDEQDLEAWAPYFGRTGCPCPI